MNDTSLLGVLGNTSFIWKFIAGTVVMFIGVTGNLTTCFVILCSRKLHTSTYTVIAMLALSDLMAVIVRYIDTFYDLYMNVFLEVYYIIWGFVYFTLHASCAHIILLFYVRYRLVVSPLLSLSNFTPSRVIRISIFLWLLSIIFGYTYGCFSYYVDVAEMGSKPVSLSTAYIVDGVVALFLIALPVIIIMIFHFKKIIIIRLSNSSSAVRLSKQMTVIIVIVITIHCASILPFCFYAWMEVYLKLKKTYLSIDIKLLRDTSIAMFFLNHTINPIIYFVWSMKMRGNSSPRQRSYITNPDIRSVSGSFSGSRETVLNFPN
ncbi:neuromedin-U receptor 2-like [Saccostrea echinata]|uniref:neuromedin-U receptor 2-like n=1 Tax=Saccostrea echinata TaxID=191078 RepID=UPI002A81B714|nr:neuromedin-U receptor 2-like [Saccostrea echinata]